MKFLNTSFTRDALGIFNFVVFCSYSWSLLVFLYEVPSFILHFSVAEIAGFLAYQLMFSLYESIVITLLLTLVLRVLPIRGIRENLVAAGGLITFSFAISTIILIQILPVTVWISRTFSLERESAFQMAFAAWLIALIILPIFSVRLARQERVSNSIVKLSENLSVLAGLYVILGVVGMVAVLFRNFS